MKVLRFFVLTIILMTFAVTSILINDISSANKKEVAAVVAYIKGKLQVQPAGTKNWSNAESGQFLYEGDTVLTRARSRAGISFVDGIETKLNSNTKFTIQEKKIEKREKVNSIKMMFGQVWSKIVQVKTKYEIHTPVAVCSVRGTEYETGVGKNGRTEVKVFSGIVEVSNKFGSVKVTKDTKSSIEPGAPPAPPVSMNKDEIPLWQDEIKMSGLMKIEFNKDTVLVNEIVEGKITVLDSKGNKDTEYKENIELTSDNSQAKFSEIDKEKWESSIKVKPQNAELKFKFKSSSFGRINISANGEGLSASMINIEAKLPEYKDLKLKVKDKDGKENDLLLRFKPK